MADESIGGTNPEWATERTLRELLGKATENTGIDKKLLLETIKSGRMTNQMANAMKDAFKKDGKAARTDRDLANLKSGLKSTATSSKDASGAVSGFGEATEDATSDLKKFGKSMGAMSVGIMGFLVQQMKEAVKTTIESVDAIRGLHNVGVAVEGSFIEFKRTIAEAGVSTEKAMALTDRYSKVLGSQGVPGLVNLSKSVYEVDQSMGKVGLTVSELAEYTGEYLEIQQRAGYYQRLDTVQQRDSMHGFMTSLTAYSRIMNISTKDMMENAGQAAKQIDWNAWLAGIVDPAERKRVNDEMAKTQALFLNQFGPEAGAKMFEELQQMVAQPAAQASSAFQSYAESGQVGFANAMAAVADGLEHGTGDVTSLIAQLGTSIDRGTMQILTANKDAIPTLSTIGLAAGQFEVAIDKVAQLTDKTYKEVYAVMLSGSKEYTDLLLTTVDETTLAAARTIQTANETVEKLDYARMQLFLDTIGVEGSGGAVDALNGLSTAMENFQDVFIDELLLNQISPGIKNFVGKIEWAIEKIDQLFGTDFGGPVTTALVGLATVLGGSTLLAAGGAGLGKLALGKILGGLGFGGAAAATTAATGAGAGAGATAMAGMALPAAAVIATALASWHAGKGVYNAYGDTEGFTDTADALFSRIDHVLGFFGNDDAQERIKNRDGIATPVTPVTGKIQRPPPSEAIPTTEPQAAINTTNMTEVELLSYIAELLTGIKQHSSDLLRQAKSSAGTGMPYA